MGKYAVPEEIRKLKPKGTVIKVVNGRYYVYTQKHIKDETSNKWKIKSGKLIGKITKEEGFIPNSDYLKDDLVRLNDFGEYFLTFSLNSSILDLLKETFYNDEAYKVFILGILSYLRGFNNFKYHESYFKLSYFSKRYPSLKISSKEVFELLNHLGRYNHLDNFYELLAKRSSKKYVIKKHIIYLEDNMELDNKEEVLHIYGDGVVNILSVYDLDTLKPLYIKMYDNYYEDNDEVALKDCICDLGISDSLCILDKQYSREPSLEYFESNKNKYIKEISKDDETISKYLNDLSLNNEFLFEEGCSNHLIKFEVIDSFKDNKKLIIFKDNIKSTLEEDEYSSKYELNDDSSDSSINHKDFSNKLGLVILESNMDETPQEIYRIYKSKENINYDYLNDLRISIGYLEDYYVIRGSSLILLVATLINHELLSKSLSIHEDLYGLLLESSFVKLYFDNNKYSLLNLTSRAEELFKKLNLDVLKELEILNKSLSK